MVQFVLLSAVGICDDYVGDVVYQIDSPSSGLVLERFYSKSRAASEKTYHLLPLIGIIFGIILTCGHHKLQHSSEVFMYMCLKLKLFLIHLVLYRSKPKDGSRRKDGWRNLSFQ